MIIIITVSSPSTERELPLKTVPELLRNMDWEEYVSQTIATSMCLR